MGPWEGLEIRTFPILPKETGRTLSFCGARLCLPLSGDQDWAQGSGLREGGMGRVSEAAVLIPGGPSKARGVFPLPLSTPAQTELEGC